MGQAETYEQIKDQERKLHQQIAEKTESGGSCGCKGAAQTEKVSPSFVYALGKIQPRFPSVSVERELAQAMGRMETRGQSDHQAFQMVLSQRENHYLVRQLSWVLTVEGIETYLLQPRVAADFDRLVEAIRPVASPLDLDVVIGLKGPLANLQTGNGLTIPIVLIDQIYSFDRDGLIKSIPRPKEVPQKEEVHFRAAAGELFDRIIQMADNTGGTDRHRALNYLAVRYPAIYTTTAECHGRNCTLNGVEVRPSRLSGIRQIVDVIFAYTHRETDVTEKYFVRVDVTEEFPFLVTKMSPYYDR